MTKLEMVRFKQAQDKILAINQATEDPERAFDEAIEWVGEQDDIRQRHRIGLGDFADGIRRWRNRQAEEQG